MDRELSEEYAEKIAHGNSLIQKITDLKNSQINGVDKLRNKIKKELAFLTKAGCCGKLKKEHILCSNLHHLSAVVDRLLVSAESTSSVLQAFHFSPSQEESTSKRLCVDIVSEGKRRWTKVIARNPKALTLISKGEGEFGQKSVLDQALEYVNCAQQNLYLFKQPIVEFHFACGIEEDLARELLDAGVVVSGSVIDAQDNLSNPSLLSPTKESQPYHMDEDVDLNLDVSTMIVYVSALTNGNLDKKLRSRVLREQACSEHKRPVKPILDKLFKGRKLFACKSAVRSFSWIVETLGGEGEKHRAKELLSRVSIVEDVLEPCSRLRVGGQIKTKSLPVFGTGLAIKAVTVTANAGFVRAASKQGLNIDVFVHESRALTENNEIDD